MKGGGLSPNCFIFCFIFPTLSAFSNKTDIEKALRFMVFIVFLSPTKQIKSLFGFQINLVVLLLDDSFDEKLGWVNQGYSTTFLMNEVPGFPCASGCAFNAPSIQRPTASSVRSAPFSTERSGVPRMKGRAFSSCWVGERALRLSVCDGLHQFNPGAATTLTTQWTLK